MTGWNSVISEGSFLSSNSLRQLLDALLLACKSKVVRDDGLRKARVLLPGILLSGSCRVCVTQEASK